jgi:hypothetical protein
MLGKFLLALLMIAPVQAEAMGGRVDVGVSIPLPPGIVFSAPPEMVVIPETYVYVVPDVDVDIYFFDGWWWRPWEGRWYRSQSYNSGWIYYQSVPTFYHEVPAGWRNDYRQRRWGGREWNYQRIPQQQVQHNWNNWKKDKHWEKQNTWGVRGLKPRVQSQQSAPAVQPQRPQPQQRPQQQVREPAQSQPQRQQPKQVRDQRPGQQHREQPQVHQPVQQQSRPQPREIKQQRPQPQQREEKQKSRPQQGRQDTDQNDQRDGNQHGR